MIRLVLAAAVLAAPPNPAAIAALKAASADLAAKAGILAPAADDPNLPLLPPQPPPDPRLDAPPVILAVPGAIETLVDCANVCPEMAIIPAGEFTQGSPPTEANRTADEVQLRRGFDQPLAVSKREITRAQYAAFADATGRPTVMGCPTDRKTPGKWADDPDASWRDPGFLQDDQHPVVCIAYDDAAAYAAWLSERTGQRYRLLTESEFEYAARAGTRTAFFWGETADGACAFANGRDAAFNTAYKSDVASVACDDGAVHTAPAGSYAPNPFGLYDMAGNVWEWTSTCLAGCERRIQRGGGWGARPEDLRSAQRIVILAGARDGSTGFRVAREL